MADGIDGLSGRPHLRDGIPLYPPVPDCMVEERRHDVAYLALSRWSVLKRMQLLFDTRSTRAFVILKQTLRGIPRIGVLLVRR